MHLTRLDELTTEIILAYGQGRLAGNFGRQPISPSGLYAIYNSVKSFLFFLDEQGISHPIVDKRQIHQKPHYKERHALRSHDIRRILSQVQEKDIAVLINLLFYTGMRISEALALQASDISPRNEIRVVGKSKHPRTVFLSESLRDELRSLYDDEGYYFRDRLHPWLPMNRKNAYYHLTSAYRRAGYTKGYSPHSERHGHATELLGSGANIALVSKELGHANIETTQIYTHLVTDDTRRMIEQYMPVMASF